MDYKNQYHMTLDAFLVKFMRERFNLTKIFKRNIEQTIISALAYRVEDSRILLFNNFLGLGNQRYRTEILNCYLLILKNLPISFFKIFELFENSNSLIISLDIVMDIYLSKFAHYDIHSQSLEKLLQFSHVSKQDKDEGNINYQEKKDIFYLNRFFNKMQNYFQSILIDYKTNTKTSYTYIDIAEKIILSNVEFDLSLVNVLEIFKRRFSLSGGNISFDQFFEFFANKYAFKIKILDFIEISVDSLVIIYESLEKKLNNLFDTITMKKKDIILNKEFEKALISVSNNNSENMWNFGEYFK